MYSFPNARRALGGLDLSFKRETIKLWGKYEAFPREDDVSRTLAPGVLPVSTGVP